MTYGMLRDPGPRRLIFLGFGILWRQMFLWNTNCFRHFGSAGSEYPSDALADRVQKISPRIKHSVSFRWLANCRCFSHSLDRLQ